MSRMKNIALLLLPLFAFYGCSVEKYIPKEKYLYRGGTINIRDSVNQQNLSGLKEALNSVLYPEPNSTFLGLYPGLHYYYKAHQKNPGFIARFLSKKIGEEPVYLSDVNIKDTKKLLRNRLENNGYFYANVGSSVKVDSAGQTAKIKYAVKIGKPFQMATYQIEKDTTDTLAIYGRIKQSLAETVLEKGEPFSLSNFKKERERIDDYLKQDGYYFFNGDFIIFQADTNRYADKRFDLYLKLKDGTPEKSKVPYVLDSVLVYPHVQNGTADEAQDTVWVDNIAFIQSGNFFKPNRLKAYVLLEPGQTYSPELSKYTSRRLSSIGTYKFVNIKYEPIDSTTDSSGRRHLKSMIKLYPLPQHTIQFNLKAVTKSNGFTGPGIGFTYTDRNIFKGGENFSIKGDFSYEKQLHQGNKIGSSSIGWGLNASLLFPRLLFPGNYYDAFRYAIPKTKISIGYDYLRRTELYTLNSFSASFQYIWDQNRFIIHKLSPIKIDYVKLSNTSPRFDKILDKNPFLRHSFEQQFIAGLMYSFTYNELSVSNRRGRLYLKYNFDIAGNLISLLGKEQPDGVETFLGLKYAQYVKNDIDVSYHYALGHSRNTILVGHLFAGLGIPYGNSRTLPFVKKYYAGGPSSVRAFPIRSLGPGTYQPQPGEYSYFDQAGNISLIANLEYRFPIISILKGAVFMDAGNVWLLHKNKNFPGGQFTSDFLSELGIGTGVGLRIDVQGFVVRFDLAFPLKRPAREWVFEYGHPVLNFAIGYPF